MKPVDGTPPVLINGYQAIVMEAVVTDVYTELTLYGGRGYPGNDCA
jgi:hypothetical protein